MRNVILLLLVVLLLSNNIYADNSSFRGLYPNLGMGIRAFGMGGAASAIINDISGVQWNPAGLKQVAPGNIDFMHTDLYGTNIKYSSIGGVFEIPKLGYTAFYLNRMDASSSLNFPYKESTIAISKAKEFSKAHLGKIQIGITGKLLPVIIDSEGYDVKAIGIGLDAGIIIKKGRMRFASIIKDPYTIVSGAKCFEGESDGILKERIAPQIVFGIGLVHDLSWRFAIDIESTEGKQIYRLGMEHWVNDNVAWRLGLNDGDLTAGFTLGVDQYDVNYGYQQSKIGNLHRIGLAVQL